MANVNRLKAVGFNDEQAAAITEIQREASSETLPQAIRDYHIDDVATKRELKELETVLRRDIKELETAQEHKIELLRADNGRMIAETNQRIAEAKADLTRHYKID